MINRLRNRLCHNNMVYEFNFLDHNKKIIDFYYKLTGINTKHIRIKETLDILDKFDTGLKVIKEINDEIKVLRKNVKKSSTSFNTCDDLKCLNDILRYMHFEK